MFTTQEPSAVVTRRSPTVIQDSTNDSQRSANRRSLSGKLRNLFRKSSSSPTRTVDYDRSLPVQQSTTTASSIRYSSASPVSVRSASEAPQLRAPTINWPFGKKKNKTSKTESTPKTSKKKSKDKQKTTPISAPPPPMEISLPVYQQGNQSSIQGEVFVPRTPEPVYSNTQRIRLTPSTTYDEPGTARGFRDYTTVDQHQPYQVIKSNIEIVRFRFFL